MRRSHLFPVLAAVLICPATGLAESPMPGDTGGQAESAAAPAGAAEDLSWEQFDDPGFDPAAADADPAAPDSAAMEVSEDPASAEMDPAGAAPLFDEADDVFAEATSAPMAGTTEGTPDSIELTGEGAVRTASGVVLGPEGIDDQGRKGRLHTVAKGDTLWDLSAAYLGTPWVWPSVWIDNDDIANPHLILPGNKIWITANEMRRVTDAEAEAFLEPRVAEAPVSQDMNMADFGDPDEAMLEDDMVPPLAALEAADDASTLDAFPVAVPGQEPSTMDAGRLVTVSRREQMGFVSAEEMEGASSIVDSPNDRTYLAEGDVVYLGLGEGDLEVGDQFTIFQALEQVRDVETNRLLGHHVERLGWLEVKELTGDTSIAEIRQSYSLVERGARIMVRNPVPRRVSLRSTPDAIEGQIVYLPASRTVMSDGGYVYLNRGEFHGVEVGSELEIYDAGGIENDRIRRVDVRTPDDSIATLVVVTVQPESSVAFVLSSSRELEVGDSVRPVVSRLAQR